MTPSTLILTVCPGISHGIKLLNNKYKCRHPFLFYIHKADSCPLQTINAAKGIQLAHLLTLTLQGGGINGLELVRVNRHSGISHPMGPE